MTKTEFQSAFDQVCESLECGGLSVSEGSSWNDILVETPDGLRLRVEIGEAEE